MKSINLSTKHQNSNENNSKRYKMLAIEVFYLLLQDGIHFIKNWFETCIHVL